MQKFLTFLAAILIMALPAFAGDKAKHDAAKKGKLPALNKITLLPPFTQTKAHKVGNIWLSVTNFGQFGNEGRRPSCEFPANSNIEYLFTGAIWIGAIVDRDDGTGVDTLVSFGFDGWQDWNELFPGFTENDSILERTNRRDFPNYDSTAFSEQDFIAVYTDTNTIYAWEGHQKPLGVEITQKSYAWRDTTAEDFVIFDYRIKNISRTIGPPKTFNKFFMGIYIDGDCGHTSIPSYYTDDITGFLRVNAVGDTFNVAWIKDNDGDNGLTPGITGIRVLFPDPRTIAYNWWDPPTDWGPTDRNDPNDYSGHPDTDAKKYRIMSNGKIDPDQTKSNPPPGINPNGMDSRYLLSFGPLEVSPDSTLRLILAYLGGQPQGAQTEFDDLVLNARRAKTVYSNPLPPPSTSALEVSVKTPARQPVERAKIVITRSGYRQELFTDNLGNASITLLYSEYTVVLSKWGFLPKTLPISISSPTTQLALTIEPGYIETFTKAQVWSLRDSSDQSIRNWYIGRAAELSGTYRQYLPHFDHTGDAGGYAAISLAFRGSSIMTSPVLDATGISNPHLQFARFYNPYNWANTQANDTLKVLLSNDNGATWKEIVAYTNIDTSWQVLTFRVADFIPPTSQMKMRFVNLEEQNAGTRLPSYCMIDDVKLVSASTVAVAEETAPLPISLELLQNYPNPFNPSTIIRWQQPHDGVTEIIVHNVLGQRVATFHTKALRAGEHHFQLRLDGHPSGVYFYQVRVNGVFSEIRKMLVMK